MHSPMHSLGESITQPRAPCSASGEWGGNRSTLPGSGAGGLRRRVPCKSGPAFAASEAGLIIVTAKRLTAMNLRFHACAVVQETSYSPAIDEAGGLPRTRGAFRAHRRWRLRLSPLGRTFHPRVDFGRNPDANQEGIGIVGQLPSIYFESRLLSVREAAAN